MASAVSLALVMFVEALGYGMVAPTLPFLARQAGAGVERIGFLVGLYAAVGLVVSIPFGLLAHRFGRRSLILVGLGCLTVASVAFIWAPTYPWLVTARFAQGVGATAIWVGSLTVVADLSPSGSLGKALSFITGAWSLGFVVGPALGGLGSVRFPFILYAGLSGAAFLAALIALPETGRPGVRTTLPGVLAILRRPAVRASAAATFSLAFFYGTIEAFVPLIIAARGVGRVRIGLLFTIAGLPAIVLPLIICGLADRYGDRRVIVAGLLYGAALNATFLFLLDRIPLWPLFVLIGLVEVLIYVPAVALLHRDVERDDRVFASGSHSYAFSAGFFVGPLLGGLLLPLGGDPVLFVMLTATMVAGVAIVLRTHDRAPARRATP